MCLAPEVDVVAAIAMTGFAADALRHNRSGRTLPLALVPAVFAVHTMSSALTWWGLRGDVPSAWGAFGTNLFIFIAFVLLPIYIPISVLLLEPRGWRRDALLLISGMGLVSGIDYLLQMLAGNTSAVACDWYIAFNVGGTAALSGVLYVAATCGALLLSGQRPLMLWGIVNAAAVVVLAYLNRAGLPSLWCFLAAATSFFVAWYLRQLSRDRDDGRPWPWQGTSRDLLVRDSG